MAGKKNRKQKLLAKRRKAARQRKSPAESSESPLELLLDQAYSGDPSRALRFLRSVLDDLQCVAASSSFDSDGGGRLWEIPEARDYLRVMMGVGVALWRLNQTAGAAEQFREVLQADAADHQLARYWLAACLLTKGRFDEAGSLLERHDDATTFWRFAQALWTFAVQGAGDDAAGRLREANALDAKFLDYVLGEASVDAGRPVHFDGDSRGTHSAARLLLPAWRMTPGAVSWARRELRVPLARRDESVPLPRQQLLALPRTNGDWQLGLHKLPQVQPDDPPNWLMAVADVGNQQMRRMAVIEETVAPAALWKELLAAFLQPTEGRPERPRRLDVPDVVCYRAWKDLLKQAGVRSRHVHDPQPVGQLLEGMSQLLESQQLPQLDRDFDTRDVPPCDATWQIAFYHHPILITNEEVGAERPWSVFVMDTAVEEVLGTEMLMGGPSAAFLWETAVRTMKRTGKRPRRIELADSDSFDFLRPKLEAADVQCVLQDELPQLDAFCLGMAADMGGPDKCALADGRGVNRDGMETFYYAAAGCYRQAPWRHLPGEVPIEIQADGLGSRYVIVLGRTGVTMGLVAFHRKRDAMDLIAGQVGMDSLTGSSVVFDEEAVMAPVDLYLLERYGWPLAAPEAYPAVMCFRPGCQPGSPSARELAFLSASLHCLPGFIASGKVSDTYSPGGAGPPMKLRISWPKGFHPPVKATAQRPPASAAPASPAGEAGPPEATPKLIASAVKHVTRKGDTYYLHQGTTKSGKPRYFFSKKSAGNLCSELPDGYEIHENPKAQVYCRRIQPKLISDEEVQVVRAALRRHGKQHFTQVDVKGKDVLVHDRGEAVFKFELCDDEKRLFEASRWCYLGSIDDWHPLLCDLQPLAALAEQYCPHVGEESFFDLL